MDLEHTIFAEPTEHFFDNTVEVSIYEKNIESVKEMNRWGIT
jgi:hypothetical protein